MQEYGNTLNASRTPQIPVALDELEKEIQTLQKNVEVLTARTASICSPTPPQLDGSNKDAPVPVRAEYVENISGKADKVRRVNRLIKDILARIEL